MTEEWERKGIYYFFETKEKNRTDKWRPAPPGVAIGNYRIAPHWGTFGCVVLKNGKKMILSNNHVLAAMNRGKKGDDIFQPVKGENIATLDSFVPVEKPPKENKVDCALAKPNKEEDITAGIIIERTYEPYFIPKGVMDAFPDQKVKQSGARSGYTTGTVISASSSLNIWHGNTEYLFEDCIVLSKMCSGGDSGALLLDESTNKAVGLIMGGSGNSTSACKIKTVLSELNCEIYTEEGGVIQAPFVPAGMERDQTQVQWNGAAILRALYYIAQTFTVGIDGSLGAISIHGPAPPPGVPGGGAGGGGIKLRIVKVLEDGTPAFPEGEILAEASIPALKGAWNTFYLSKPVPCHIANKFAFVLEGVEPYPTDCPVGRKEGYSIMFSGESSYPSGEMFVRWKDKEKWLVAQEHDEDLAFITWVIPPKKVILNSIPATSKIYINGKQIVP